MNDETKILLDRIESTAKNLDKYFFILIFFIIYGFSTLLQKDESMMMPFLGTKISNEILFHAIISITISTVYGMIGSGLLDYFTRRKLFDDQLSQEHDEKKKSLRDSLISGSLYDSVYRTKDYSEISRWVLVAIMTMTLIISNIISLIHAFKIIRLDYRIGIPIFSLSALILLILLFSFIKTILKKVLFYKIEIFRWKFIPLIKLIRFEPSN